MRVFSSMRADQIDVRDVNEGAVLLRQYLQYAQTGEYPASRISVGGADSPFESAVKRALERRGYRVVPQVGDSGYRIDLGVVDDEMPGRYLCGIECDGATYHSAATVRDRDRLRQQVLELRGWEIHRVWSTDWFQDPKSQIERLVNLIETSRERIRRGELPATPPPSRPAAPPVGPGPDGSAEPPLEPERTPLEDIEVPPYRFAPMVKWGEPEAFYTAPIPQIARAVTEIVEVEAPIHITELTRRVAACWGMQRAGSQIAHRVEKAIAHLAARHEIIREDDFVRLNSDTPAPVRSRAIEGQNFSSDHISPAEVVEAVRLLLQHRAPWLPDVLVTETPRLLGFARTGAKLKERIETAKEQLVQNGELRAGGRGIRLAEVD
jgi:very-short-patch-repair endonuclease